MEDKAGAPGGAKATSGSAASGQKPYRRISLSVSPCAPASSHRCYLLLKLAILFASHSWTVAKYRGANRRKDAISALLPVFASSWR